MQKTVISTQQVVLEKNRPALAAVTGVASSSLTEHAAVQSVVDTDILIAYLLAFFVSVETSI